MSQFLIRYSTKYLNSKFNSEFQNSLKIWQTKHFLILLKSNVDLLCSDKQFQPTQNVTWKNVSKKMKSYLYYKTITTENVSSKDQVQIFFQLLFCSQDIQVLVFLTILCGTKSVTSWRALAHETRCIF